MDINDKINWMSGMELTAETFRQLEYSLDFKQRLALIAALGRNQLGLLPGSEFNCNGVFVKNTFEITDFKCIAILPSGKIISAAQEVVVNIPILYGEEYYLGVNISDERHEFEREGVPFYNHVYTFALYSLEDLKKKDLFPVAKFTAKDGVLSLYPDYIVPSLIISENKKYFQFKEKYIESLETITSHSNLEDGDGKRSLLRYLFILKSLNPESNVSDFISLIQEMAYAIDYFIVTPYSETHKDIPLPDYYDIERWLVFVESFLEGAKRILDKVVLEDNTIDFNALLEQAKKELYEKLQPELLEKLPKEIKEEVYKDITEKIKEFLPNYLKEKLDEIQKLIGADLVTILEPKLFDDLYKKLYEALYIAPEEEDEFMPTI
ncbi:MAG: hypothetical protein J1F67_06620 [Muribaculaceae bacterium]|nr:hypothetical protein [Muribaculaceae bacterium]